MFTLQTSFNPLLLRWGGGGGDLLVEIVNSKEETSQDVCPNSNYVQEFGISYFTSPFAIAIRLEMRLSVSPATPFSVASLTNHTKMFELDRTCGYFTVKKGSLVSRLQPGCH
jgi:hypothetical protein